MTIARACGFPLERDRRSLRDAGADSDAAEARDADTVEHYRQ